MFGALICPDTGVFGSQKQPKREVIKLITSILSTIYPLPRNLSLPTGRKAGKDMFFNNTILILLKTFFLKEELRRKKEELRPETIFENRKGIPLSAGALRGMVRRKQRNPKIANRKSEIAHILNSPL